MRKVLLFCFIFSLSLTIGSVGVAQQSYVGCTLSVVQNFLRYRSSPELLDDNILGEAVPPNQFTILEESNDWVKISHPVFIEAWMATYTPNSQIDCVNAEAGNHVSTISQPSTTSTGTISFESASGPIHSVSIGRTCPRRGNTWDTTVIWELACYAAHVHYPDDTKCLIILGHTGVNNHQVEGAFQPIIERGGEITRVSLTYEGIPYSYNLEYYEHHYPKNDAQRVLSTYCNNDLNEVPTVIVQFSNPIVAQTDPNYTLFTETTQIWVGRQR